MNQRTARLAANSMDENCGYAASALTAFGVSSMLAAMRDIGVSLCWPVNSHVAVRDELDALLGFLFQQQNMT